MSNPYPMSNLDLFAKLYELREYAGKGASQLLPLYEYHPTRDSSMLGFWLAQAYEGLTNAENALNHALNIINSRKEA